MAEFRMPSLGADMEAGRLVKWRAQPGDVLERGDIIAEVETDKGIVEVELYEGGVLERCLVEPGNKVPVGTLLAVLHDVATATKQAEPVPALSSPPLAHPAVEVPIAAPPSARRLARELGVDLRALTSTDVPRVPDVERAAARAAAGATVSSPAASAVPRLRISPAARRRAEELKIDVSRLHGTGPEGAITLADVERVATEPPMPAAATTSLKPDRQSALRRAIAVAMARSKREIPHYYLSTTIDLGAAMAWLTARNAQRSVRERLLAGVLLLKAAAIAAKRVPQFNATWQDEQATLHDEVNLGVAVALRGGGLIAPAIHRADALDLDALMLRLQDLVARARAGSLRSSELSDGTITVTSLGERGVESVFPIIYAPQTAIVGFGRIVERPWVVAGAVVARPVVTATLAADHRVTDGHLGARFLALIDQLLQEPDRL